MKIDSDTFSLYESYIIKREFDPFWIYSENGVPVAGLDHIFLPSKGSNFDLSNFLENLGINAISKIIAAIIFDTVTELADNCLAKDEVCFFLANACSVRGYKEKSMGFYVEISLFSLLLLSCSKYLILGNNTF